MKKFMSLLIALVMVFGVFAVVPVKVDAAVNKVLYTDSALLKKVGAMPSGSKASACYALAYAKTMVDGYTHYYYEYNKYGKDQNKVSCDWDKANSYAGPFGYVGNFYKPCVNCINENRPILVKANHSKYGQQWVVVVGYENFTGVISEKCLLIIDPLRGYTGAPENMAKLGYTISDSGESAVLVDVCTKPIIGDADGNGKVSVKDATEIQKSVAGIVYIGYELFDQADSDKDAKITVKDATRVQKYLADIITKL